MRLYPLLALPFLFACATPQQACIGTVSKDLIVVERLIAETERNLARGYATVREPGVQSGLELCVEPDDVLFCTTERLTVEERPVALDVTAERAKLAALQDKRRELSARSAATVAQCRAKYPE